MANFTGDNNIFEGTVTQSVADTNGQLIQLDVPGLGTLLCQGDYAQMGGTAACCVRADLIQLKPLAEAEASGLTPAINRVTARITAVEFTGYITRVALVLERTGAEVLYKARTPDWMQTAFQEGQIVALDWAAADCIFLAH